jgi:hypothetical protein
MKKLNFDLMKFDLLTLSQTISCLKLGEIILMIKWNVSFEHYCELKALLLFTFFGVSQISF